MGRFSIFLCAIFANGGERGIRTLEPREGLPVFKTGVFNRSTSSPSTVLLVLSRDIKQFLKLTRRRH